MADGWVDGLPPAAAARMQRMRADGVKTSFLSVAGAVAAGSVGLRPLGEVMGTAVVQIGWRGWAGCGAWSSAPSAWANPRAFAPATSFAGYKPYTDAVRGGYRAALDRLRAEAVALGADGIVGVRLTSGHLGGGAMSVESVGTMREFLALGSAVRVDGDVRPPVPFVTDLSGTDTAKLMHSGWVPSSLAFGLAVAIRHDDYRTTMQSSRWSGNTEIDGYTQLVQHVRARAREDFRQRLATSENDGALLSANFVNIWSIEPAEGHTDHVAEAFVLGSSIAQFHRGAAHPAAALSIMPLRRK
ncbi:MAG: hypothetical protein QOK14_1665 [Frankiaceae bacterium]|nr:hypothetical protein [Frankiaceae bacterium]